MTADPHGTRDFIIWVAGICLLILAAAGALATVPGLMNR
jgi:hypothetical protein